MIGINDGISGCPNWINGSLRITGSGQGHLEKVSKKRHNRALILARGYF